jgi:hypothetical protein
MPKHKRTQSRPKPLYRVQNWAKDEKALVQRGSITFWLSDDLERVWKSQEFASEPRFLQAFYPTTLWCGATG